MFPMFTIETKTGRRLTGFLGFHTTGVTDRAGDWPAGLHEWEADWKPSDESLYGDRSRKPICCVQGYHLAHDPYTALFYKPLFSHKMRLALVGGESVDFNKDKMCGEWRFILEHTKIPATFANYSIRKVNEQTANAHFAEIFLYENTRWKSFFNNTDQRAITDYLRGLPRGPTCDYCDTPDNVRLQHDGYGPIPPSFICEECFTGTDDGPCFDDLEPA